MKRAVSRDACWVIMPPTVDDVLDHILSAARSKALGEGGASGWWQAHGVISTTFVCKGMLAKSSAHWVERGHHGNHSEGKEQDEMSSAE